MHQSHVKQVLCALSLACGLLSPDLARAQAIGLSGGLNRSSLSGDHPEKIQYGKAARLQVGGFGEFRFLGDTQLRVELSYTQRGTRIGHEVPDQREPNFSSSLDLDYVSVPVLLKIRSDSGRFYTTSGLDLSFLLTAELREEGQADIDVKDQLLGTDLAINFGFGGLVRRDSPQVGLEVRYSQSLLNLGENVQTARAIPVRFRSSGLQFLVSVGMPMWGGE